MICLNCAAAADLTTAARGVNADHELIDGSPIWADRIGDVRGRPSVLTVIGMAVINLHTKCAAHGDCSCQHRTRGLIA